MLADMTLDIPRYKC